MAVGVGFAAMAVGCHEAPRPDPSASATASAVRAPNPDPAAERAIRIADACARGPDFQGKGMNHRPLDFSRAYAHAILGDAGAATSRWRVNFGEVFPGNEFTAPSGLYLVIDIDSGNCVEDRPME
jgi:hypothetical protein